MHCPYTIKDIIGAVLLTSAIIAPSCLLLGYWNGLAGNWRYHQKKYKVTKEEIRWKK